jgi:hypothetical protein
MMSRSGQVRVKTGLSARERERGGGENTGKKTLLVRPRVAKYHICLKFSTLSKLKMTPIKIVVWFSSYLETASRKLSDDFYKFV